MKDFAIGFIAVTVCVIALRTIDINMKLDAIQAEVHQIKEAVGIYDKEEM